MAAGCSSQPSSASSTAAAPAQATQATAPATHLRIEGTAFRTPDGAIWPWRGITSFRLLEMLAAGKGSDVDAYLDWAAEQNLTVVRVLAMAKHIFELPPATGRAHLEDLLTRAKRHSLHVEIVALADTASYDLSIEEHLREVGRIAARHSNAIVELANEPYHPTQVPAVQDVRTLESWLPLIPSEVPVAVGALERADGSRAGDFATFHFPRSVSQQGWGHVIELAAGHEVQQRLGMPLVNDEPIGAGERFEPGRRDDNPDRFRAAALLTRMTGMGATFHYDGGLQSRLPSGRELESFKAWQEAWTHLPPHIETAGRFSVAGAAGAASQVSGAAGAWEVRLGDQAWLLVVHPGGEARVEWRQPWREVERITWTDSQLRRASRKAP